MFINLINDLDIEGWLHIWLKLVDCNGSPISRNEGVTLVADSAKFSLFKGLVLDYYGDLRGGFF